MQCALSPRPGSGAGGADRWRGQGLTFGARAAANTTRVVVAIVVTGTLPVHTPPLLLLSLARAHAREQRPAPGARDGVPTPHHCVPPGARAPTRPPSQAIAAAARDCPGPSAARGGSRRRPPPPRPPSHLRERRPWVGSLVGSGANLRYKGSPRRHQKPCQRPLCKLFLAEPGVVAPASAARMRRLAACLLELPG